MKITITRKDWKKGINYLDCCGCLLAHAVGRKFNTRAVYVWKPGIVEIGDEDYSYVIRGIESRLRRAHKDPSLLPITIELK